MGELCEMGLKTDGELVNCIHIPFNEDHWTALESA
jgi:hypothetical protein